MKNKNINGNTEFYLNTNVIDGAGFREYLAYKVFNEMGVNTQGYGLGDLSIGKEHVGLITIIEVINENYVFEKYNSEEGNLYKPEAYGAEMSYLGDKTSLYIGIFNKIETQQTDEQDKARLVSIIKKLNETESTKEIEDCFIDFDKVIKIVAINKVIGNVDGFTGKTTRNFYIYEENGKIDILPFDFNISFGVRPETSAFTEGEINAIDLIEYYRNRHSIIIDLIMENEAFLEKYNLYVQQTIENLEKMQNEKIVDEIENRVDVIVKNTENEFFTYEEHKQEVEKLKRFVENRVNMKK